MLFIKGKFAKSSFCLQCHIFRCEFVILQKPLLGLTFSQTLILFHDVLKLQTNSRQISLKKNKKNNLKVLHKSTGGERKINEFDWFSPCDYFLHRVLRLRILKEATKKDKVKKRFAKREKKTALHHLRTQLFLHPQPISCPSAH